MFSPGLVDESQFANYERILEKDVKTFTLKKMSLPKIAVLATGAVAALLAVTLSPQAASAHPALASACSSCHTAGGSVVGTPSAATVAPGASYTVALAFTGGTSPVGYWISGNGASVTGSNAGPVSMTAPAAAGSYTYTVWMRSGVVATSTYTIKVAATVPPTTVPPTTAPPTTVPPTTVPPTSSTTTPPVSATTAPPVSTATIRSLSPTHGSVGTRVTIRGTVFGTAGVVKFGSTTARVSSWTATSITVKVPAANYRGAVSVTVTSKGAAASNAIGFRIESGHHDN